jgi:hypothetical protein
VFSKHFVNFCLISSFESVIGMFSPLGGRMAKHQDLGFFEGEIMPNKLRREEILSDC